MSESELNSYRFSSGQEPSDEQLQAIMEAALADVERRAKEAKKKYDELFSALYETEYSKISQRIENARNGIFR